MGWFLITYFEYNYVLYLQASRNVHINNGRTAFLARYGNIMWKLQGTNAKHISNHSVHRLVRGHYRWCSGVVVFTTVDILRVKEWCRMWGTPLMNWKIWHYCQRSTVQPLHVHILDSIYNDGIQIVGHSFFWNIICEKQSVCCPIWQTMVDHEFAALPMWKLFYMSQNNPQIVVLGSCFVITFPYKWWWECGFISCCVHFTYSMFNVFNHY